MRVCSPRIVFDTAQICPLCICVGLMVATRGLVLLGQRSQRHPCQKKRHMQTKAKEQWNGLTIYGGSNSITNREQDSKILN